MDAKDIYRRAELERRIAQGVLDGKSEDELCELLGLPSRDMSKLVNMLAYRVQRDATEIARIHAMRQTVTLTQLYASLAQSWEETKDPRYMEQMRGTLSDIRKIWGVEADKRIILGGKIDVKAGVLGGILGKLSDTELGQLGAIFEGRNGGGSEDGAGVPALEGVCEVSESVSVD